MSDTDDTDDLLLIPPDFFVIDSDLEDHNPGPYYSVVENLITVVNKIESRLNSIENSTDISSIGESIRHNFMSETRRSFSSDELKYCRDGIDSTQSTPQKPKSTFQINSLPSTPNVQRHNFRKSRNNYEKLNAGNNQSNDTKNTQKSKIFSDINEFISNVNTLKQISAQRNLGKQFGEASTNLTDKQLLLDLKNDLKTQLIKRGFDVMPTENIQSKDGSTINRLPNDQMSTVHDSSSDFSTENESFNSQQTVCQIANGKHYDLKKEVYNALGIDCLDESREIKKANAGDEITNRLNLISLQDLWANKSKQKSMSSSLQQKLEEEKIKRQHCELTIQALQAKILEMQEKIAVAMEVDKSKDDAILKFHNAWDKVAFRIQSLTNERNKLEEDLKQFQATSALDLSEAAKKVAHYEQEASKALNLAHSTQDKSNILEKTNYELKNKLKELENKLSEKLEALKRESDKCGQLADILLEKESEHNKTKMCLENARTEISESKKAVDLCQAEFIKMKTQYTQLELQMNDDKDYIKQLVETNKNLQTELDAYKKSEKQINVELNKLKEQHEQNKIELRNFYQGQVEIVVKDKLKEFQTQLDQAESSLHDELKKRETTIIKSAALHIQQLSEKHQLEIQLLEEKHKEEVRLYHIKLSQSQKQIEELQEKINQHKEYKSIIAEKLQRVMEAQLHEAIKILNSGRSPGLQQESSCPYDQLNTLKSQSYTNLQELLLLHDKHIEPKMFKDNNIFDSSSAAGDFGKPKFENIDETPVSSHQPRTREQIENHLQKLVTMLSSKSGDRDVDSTSLKFHEDCKMNRCTNKKHKPPWK